MKIKTTLILFVVFLVLFVLVYFLEIKGKSAKEEEEKLADFPADDVQKITFKKEDETLSFKKNEEGEWLITEPLEAKADKYEVDRLAEDFSKLKIERVVEEEPEDISKYNIPQKEITLWYKDRELPLKILVGMENPLDKTFFAKREDELRVVLIPSHLSNVLGKKVFDFRQKEIFKFETDEVKRIKVRAKETQWKASQKEEEWFFSEPVNALAKKSDIDDILSSLSNLKAKEFVSEEKKKEEIKKYGLDKPEYEIAVSMPLANKEMTFLLHHEEDKVFATSSLSPKIIEVEDSILSDLEKTAEELRDKDVANFYTWEVDQVHLKRGKLEIKVFKDQEDKWYFDFPEKEEADEEKIRNFIRKIDTLETEEFIDPPVNLTEHGLDKPQAEIKIRTKEDEEKVKEVTILVGKEDKEAKKVVVKNAKLDYLFKVDSSFLEEFPKEIKEWKVQEEEKEENKK